MFSRIAILPILALALSGCALLGGRGAAPGAEPLVRVLIIEGAENLQVMPEATYLAVAGENGVGLASESKVTVEPAESTVRVLVDGAQVLEGPVVRLAAADPGGLLAIRGVPFGVGWWWEGAEERRYDGVVEVRLNDAGLINAIVELSVEEYLRGVVPSEIGSTAPAEALKAQAVAARSETITALRERQYAGPHYDICSDVNCQVYAGIGKRNDATDAAIVATRGLVLAYDGESIPAYYASNCGGYSEDIENVWAVRDRGIPCWTGSFDGSGDPPADLTEEDNLREWVTTLPDAFCSRYTYPGLPEWTQKNYRWTVETKAEDLSARVAETKDIGRVIAIEPIERGVSGRLIRVRFVGEKGDLEVGPELAIRRIWKPPLKSACFAVTPIGAGDMPDAFRIDGAGYGHGVGMCQTGAMGRALVGQDFRQILQHYYQGAEIMAVYE